MRAVRIVGFVLALAIVGGIALFLWFRQASQPSHEGTIRVPLLQQPIRIERDEHGVPRVIAASEQDAAFGLGYAHAQDRLWQMEMNRRIAGGAAFRGSRPGGARHGQVPPNGRHPTRGRTHPRRPRCGEPRDRGCVFRRSERLPRDPQRPASRGVPADARRRARAVDGGGLDRVVADHGVGPRALQPGDGAPPPGTRAALLARRTERHLSAVSRGMARPRQPTTWSFTG